MYRIYSYTCLRWIFVFLVILFSGFSSPVFGESFNEPPVLEGLYAWFPMGADSMDIGPNWSPLKVVGASPVADRSGNSKDASYFNGSYSYIQLELININPSRKPQMSVAMWVKPEREGCLFSNDNGGRGRSVSIENRSGKSGVSIQVGKKFEGINLPMNEWSFVVATFDNKLKYASLYVKNQKIIKKNFTNVNAGEGFNTVKIGKIQITRHHSIPYKEYFYSLYKDPKKLAYFFNIKDPSSLKVPYEMNPKKQAYINLKGEVFEPGGNIPALNSPGKDETITEKTALKVLCLIRKTEICHAVL